MSDWLIVSIASAERTTTGLPRTTGGKSHSWVTPASRSANPSAQIISVAEGRNDTIRSAASISITLASVAPARPRDPLGSTRRAFGSVDRHQVAEPKRIAAYSLSEL